MKYYSFISSGILLFLITASVNSPFLLFSDFLLKLPNYLFNPSIISFMQDAQAPPGPDSFSNDHSNSPSYSLANPWLSRSTKHNQVCSCLMGDVDGGIGSEVDSTPLHPSYKQPFLSFHPSCFIGLQPTA
jgi:hypothetical protein